MAEKSNRNLGIGVVLGIGMGIALGTALGNLGLGMSFGIAFGVAFGVAFGTNMGRIGTARKLSPQTRRTVWLLLALAVLVGLASIWYARIP